MASLSNEELKKLLEEGGFLSKEQLSIAEKSTQSKEMSLEQALLMHEFISDTNLGQLIATELGLPFVRLSAQHISNEALNLLPKEYAISNKLMVFKVNEQSVQIAVHGLKNNHLLDQLKKKFGDKLQLFYATENDLKQSHNLFKSDSAERIQKHAQNALTKRGKSDNESEMIELVDELLEYAYISKASDLHIEPSDIESTIRFRIDGVLSDALKLPKELHDHIITRLKIMSHLRTDEHFSAQDGPIKYSFSGEKVDIRLSILPTTFGEKAVMRLLSEKARQFSLEELGLDEADFEKLKQQASKPWGMILVTGPTGSGKTTTLYAIMKILNRRSVNISTIEDPVEYSIAGVNQVQVNRKTELTFAKGLRSLVRQDPDIIMVGEIRDQETAGISINAALTGHLLLSTLHTNDAATALPRLLDMEVEPFLVASTVNMVIAQRLVRRICSKCITSTTVKMEEIEAKGLILPDSVKEKIFKNGDHAELYKGAGCKVCKNSGYRGRMGVFEILETDGEIRKMILENQSSDVIKEHAVKNGMHSMLDDGINKVLQGKTTLEEILRVVRE